MDDAKIQELSDVREIIDVMNQYTTALDTRNWPMLEATMTPDGQADFGNLAGVGVLESPQALVDLCRKSLQDLKRHAAPAGQLRRRGERRHRTGELLPPGQPLRRRPAGRRRVRRVGASTATTSSAPRTGGRSRSATSTRSHAGGNMNLFAEAAEAAGRTANA